MDISKTHWLGTQEGQGCHNRHIDFRSKKQHPKPGVQIDPSCTLSVCTTEPSKGALPQSGLCLKGPICIRVPREPLWKTMGFGDVPDSLEHSVLWMLSRASGPQGREVWNCGQFPPCVQVSMWAGVGLVHMQARQVGCHGNHFQSVFLLD